MLDDKVKEDSLLTSTLKKFRILRYDDRKAESIKE